MVYREIDNVPDTARAAFARTHADIYPSRFSPDGILRRGARLGAHITRMHAEHSLIFIRLSVMTMTPKLCSTIHVICIICTSRYAERRLLWPARRETHANATLYEDRARFFRYATFRDVF